MNSHHRHQGSDRPHHRRTPLELVEHENRAGLPGIGDVHEGRLGRRRQEAHRDEDGRRDRHSGSENRLARIENELSVAPRKTRVGA